MSKPYLQHDPVILCVRIISWGLYYFMPFLSVYAIYQMMIGDITLVEGISRAGVTISVFSMMYLTLAIGPGRGNDLS